MINCVWPKYIFLFVQLSFVQMCYLTGGMKDVSMTTLMGVY